MAYAWIIDKDHLDGTDTGVIGPRGANALMVNALQTDKKVGEAFRMRDDDGELYYSGRILFDHATELEDETELAPLDDFGMPNAGCTTIEYRNSETKKWEAVN